MNRIRILPSIFLSLSFLLFIPSCSDDAAFQEVSGILQWGGEPEVDGSGMIFITADEEYGVKGHYRDYKNYFKNDLNRSRVLADFSLTGKETVRGWGATYPEIEMHSILVIDYNPD